MIRGKRVWACLLSALLAFGLCACGDDWEDYEDYEDYGEEPGTGSGTGRPMEGEGASDPGSGTSQVVAIDDQTPMGEDGTWTIFVYLCGSDLESDGGMGTMDLEEMTDSDWGGKVRFVVETGGASDWESDVSEEELERYVIEGGEMRLVESKPQAGMGESDTAADFLSWGVANYPAARMGVVFWNHGSGSINGVCFDENDDNDSLTLKEMTAAFNRVAGSMTDRFEFVGFDACLMGTVETALMLRPYARYMYGSEESEPGYGWDYKAIGEYLSGNPGADGAGLGRVVCDSFYESCEQTGEENICTLSVIRLDAVPEVVSAFDAFSSDVYEATGDEAKFSGFARSMTSVDNYGGNNKNEGYTNMVDLGGLAEAGSDLSDDSGAVTQAIQNAVVYQVRGSDHANASGLAVYYPLQVQGSAELTTFREVCVSPYYLGLVDKIAYGFANAGNISDYDNSEMVESYEEYEDDWSGWDDWDWSYLDEGGVTGESKAISFDEAPHLDGDGYYTFVLSDEGYYNAASVQATVYMLTEDEEEMICMGLSTADVAMDWETGRCTDNFDGTWYALPDGQPLCAYLVEECDGYDIFTAPIELNGEETNLRFIWDYEEDAMEITGIWDGVDEYGASGRNTTELKAGDVIVPLYDAYAMDSDDEFYYAGEEYVFDGDTGLIWTWLSDGVYLFGFSIDDIYGDYYVTDFVCFEVEGEDVYFSEWE
ncbi:MAG: Clostripain family protein [Lachnospiraceae bacterium]|nr:Clostripain family protein [Lachnospiraceae bacterium]